MSAWERILAHVEHAPVELEWEQLRAYASLGYPLEPVEVGGVALFGVTEVDESWPEEWVPLQPPTDHATLVVFEESVWVGRRDQDRNELDADPVFETVDAFLEAAAMVLDAQWDSDGRQRWLTAASEDQLWRDLPNASKVFDVFQLQTRAGYQRFLAGEARTGAVVSMLGVFFLACTLAFLVAPFGSVTTRIIFVAVVGCVPLALVVYGYRAFRRGVRGLQNVASDGPSAAP